MWLIAKGAVVSGNQIVTIHVPHRLHFVPLTREDRLLNHTPSRNDPIGYNHLPGGDTFVIQGNPDATREGLQPIKGGIIGRRLHIRITTSVTHGNT